MILRLVVLFSLISSSVAFAATEEELIKKKIESNLFIPAIMKRSDKVGVIGFDIDSNGRVSNLLIAPTKLAKPILNQCLLAIRKSEPFENISTTRHFNYACKNPKLEPKYRKISKQYMKSVQKKVKANWRPIQYKSPYRVGLKFNIDSSGRAINVQSALSSGNVDNDLMAVKAVEAASPFPPLPRDLLGNGDTSIPVEFTLDYNVRQRSSKLEKANLILNILDLAD